MMKDTAKILLILQLSVRIGEYNIKSMRYGKILQSWFTAFKDKNQLVRINSLNLKKIESVSFNFNIRFVHNWPCHSESSYATTAKEAITLVQVKRFFLAKTRGTDRALVFNLPKTNFLGSLLQKTIDSRFDILKPWKIFLVAVTQKKMVLKTI